MRIEEEIKGRTTDLHVGEACLSWALELDEALIDDGEGSRQRQKQKSRGALQLELQDRSDPSVGRSQHKEGYKWSSTGEGHM